MPTPALRPLPSELCTQLAKFLTLLASDQPGEVAAAVEACNRALKKHGRDWHDVVGRILDKTAVNTPATYGPNPTSNRQSYYPHQSQYYRELDSTEIIVKILAKFANVSNRGAKLNARANEFLSQMLYKARKYPTVRMSAKQYTWYAELVGDDPDDPPSDPEYRYTSDDIPF